ATWIWRDDGGYLIAANGGVSILDRGDDALPSGLLLALRHAAAGSRIVVRGPEALAQNIDAWSRATGVQFTLADEWNWRDAGAPAVRTATNLLTPDLESVSLAAPRDRRPRWLRRALWWAGAALLLHAGASVADWAILQWRAA